MAHPNIALIKYWGKRPGPGNLPAVGSLSVTLDTLATQTQVQLDTALTADSFHLNGVTAAPEQAARAQRFMDAIRGISPAGPRAFAHVHSSNNFPTGAGLASSASGFAALALAASRAYGLTLTEAELSQLARTGSGSAARSIFGGYVLLSRGTRDDGTDCVARPLLTASAWPLNVVVAVTDAGAKAVGSTAGMAHTQRTSPYWQAWIDGQEADLAEAARAVDNRDFAALTEVAEHSCFKMHALALSARPRLLYWLPGTLAAMAAIARLRADGVPVFCSIDAGPQVKAICLPEACARVHKALAQAPGVLRVLTAGLGPGAQVLP